MEKIEVAVIGGSGIYKLDSIKIIKEHFTTTPFGEPSDNILECEMEGVKFYFLPRHGRGHRISPSEVNYRANIFALKSLGAKNIVSISAVGSLKEEHYPTKFVLIDQFIDWTKGKRERSFFTKGMVGHVSTAYPVEKSLLNRIAEVCKQTEIDHSVGGSYVCIEGPQFSTRAESMIYRSFGADVIGMTNVPESYLAKEAGMAYATVAMITDYDCWKEEHCTVDEIMKVMNTNNVTAQKLVKELIPSLVKNPIEFTPENSFAVITGAEHLTEDHKAIIKVLNS